MKRLPDSMRVKSTYVDAYVTRGLSVRQVAAEIGVSDKFVRDRLNEFGVELRPIGRAKWVATDARTREAYAKLYAEQGMSIREVAKELGVCSDVAMKDMARFGVALRPHIKTAEELAERELLGAPEPRPEPVVRRRNRLSPRALRNSVTHVGLDFAFFERIDSPVKAYALGLMWTDGSISEYDARITLQDTDREALESLRVAMGAGPLAWAAPVGKGTQPTVTLRVASRPLIASLERLGFCRDKSSLTPEATRPPNEFLRDFVRGLMDGDGSLFRPDYPTVAFYNQNASLRVIVADYWQSVTGKRPPTYAPVTQGKPRSRVCEIGHRAVAIARDLYLSDTESIGFARKRLLAEQFQSWRRNAAD